MLILNYFFLFYVQNFIFKNKFKIFLKLLVTIFCSIDFEESGLLTTKEKEDLSTTKAKGDRCHIIFFFFIIKYWPIKGSQKKLISQDNDVTKF